MQVQKDIKAALDLVNNKKVDDSQYRKVTPFTDYSLKHFKKYKLDGRNVLTRLGNYQAVCDLVSYGANVTCFSDNRFDEYFLELFLATISLGYGFHTKVIGDRISLYKNKYNVIREKLSDNTRYFFDALYQMPNQIDIFKSLIVDSKYNFEEYSKSVRYYLKAKYNIIKEILEEKKVEFKRISNDLITSSLKEDDETYSFINLSYNLDCMKSKEFNRIMSSLDDFSKILSDYGKIQVFTTKDEEIILPEFKRIQTRSIDDVNTSKKSCNNEYAYVYCK